MRVLLILFGVLFLTFGCKDTVISKPKNLIEEDKMENIIYDLALLEGIKSYNPTNFQNIKSNEYVYKKYKIDSLQFVKSTQFYASDISKYKKMYERVQKRLDDKKNPLDSLFKKTTDIQPKKELQNKGVVK